MQEFLPASWGPQIMAFTKQNPLQVFAVTLTVIGILITLTFGRRGFGSGDGGGCSFGDGDGDAGGCGGD
jgi:hypothetical protein